MTSWAVNGLPSCHVTPSRNVTSHTSEAALGVHLVASPGCTFRSLSMRTSESNTANAIATVMSDEPAFAGLNDSDLPAPTIPTRSVPPRRGGGAVVAVVGIRPFLLPQAANAEPPASSSPAPPARRRSSRRGNVLSMVMRGSPTRGVS
jgi:hypothetical protein